MTELTKNQRDWLRSLARMQIRKRERELPNIAPKPGQDPAEFAAFKAHLEERLSFARSTLTALRPATALPSALEKLQPGERDDRD